MADTGTREVHISPNVHGECFYIEDHDEVRIVHTPGALEPFYLDVPGAGGVRRPYVEFGRKEAMELIKWLVEKM